MRGRKKHEEEEEQEKKKIANKTNKNKDGSNNDRYIYTHLQTHRIHIYTYIYISCLLIYLDTWVSGCGLAFATEDGVQNLLGRSGPGDAGDHLPHPEVRTCTHTHTHMSLYIYTCFGTRIAAHAPQAGKSRDYIYICIYAPPTTRGNAPRCKIQNYKEL